MAKKLGNDYRLWISSGGAEPTYAEIKGQTSLKITRQANQIDTSTKDDFPYGTQAPGLKTLTIDVELIPNLPDTTGYDVFETAALGSDPAAFQVRKGGSAGAIGDVVFDGSLYIGNFSTDMSKNAALTVSAQLTLAAAPTTDKLA